MILWGREEAGLREAAEGVEAHNVPCTYMICDVANDEDVQKQVQGVRKQFTYGNYGSEICIFVSSYSIGLKNEF